MAKRTRQEGPPSTSVRVVYIVASTSPPTTRGLAEALVGASNFNPLAFGRENGIHLESEEPTIVNTR